MSSMILFATFWRILLQILLAALYVIRIKPAFFQNSKYFLELWGKHNNTNIFPDACNLYFGFILSNVNIILKNVNLTTSKL